MSSNLRLNDKKARPTRPTAGLGLSRERILDKALELADARGLECLSMRTLASALGCKAMSLYNHVSSRDELVAELVDRVDRKSVVEGNSVDLGGRRIMTKKPGNG